MTNNSTQPKTLAPENFDLRTLERFIADGSILPADYQAYLDGIEDSADNAEVSNVTMLTHRRTRRIEHNSQDEEEG